MARSLAVSVRPLDPTSEEAARLLRLADEYATALYPPESNHLDSAEALSRPNVAFLGAYVGFELVGCGAVKLMKHDIFYGEIKRLFVVDAHRGNGIASAVMRNLEERARDAGAECVLLETGVNQPEALSLYRKLGYAHCDPFGAYEPDPLSVFMKKRL
jgi:putative acetyltransferase